MKVETAIQGFYEGKLQKTTDFEEALTAIDKEELVEFIINCQCQQRFKDFQAKGDYNCEFKEIFGKGALDILLKNIPGENKTRRTKQ